MNPDHLSALYTEHHAPMLRKLRGAVRTPSGHEDALQATWTVLAGKPDGYLDPDTAGAWLFVVARRFLLAELRGQSTRSLDELGDRHALDTLGALGDSGTAGILAHLELGELLGHLDTLKPAERRSQLAQMLGLTYHQEEAATGRSYTAVNRTRTEGRRHLRELAG